MILSTETSPMSHVTVSVVGGSKSYLKGGDPMKEVKYVIQSYNHFLAQSQIYLISHL